MTRACRSNEVGFRHICEKQIFRVFEMRLKHLEIDRTFFTSEKPCDKILCLPGCRALLTQSPPSHIGYQRTEPLNADGSP